MISRAGQLDVDATARGAGGDVTDERGESSDGMRNRLLSRAAESAPDLAELLGTYYRHVPGEEFAQDEPAYLAATVRAHRALAAERVSGRAVVRVFNPDPDTDGWESSATIVQIVTDDMPYLVDSVTAELGRSGAEVRRIIHPIIAADRDVTGQLREVLPSADPAAPPSSAITESWMCVEVDKIVDPERLAELEGRLLDVLNDVREVVEDVDRMHTTARTLAEELEQNPPPLPAEDVHDGAQLLRWLADGHFTFLGYRHYALEDADSGEGTAVSGGDGEAGANPALRAVLASGLGVLRHDSVEARRLTAGPDALSTALAPQLMVLTQASASSTVHRPVHPFYVGVKTFDESGRVTGEHRFLGLFTTTALHENVLDIPVIERRVRTVIHRAGFPLESYSGQQMLEEIQDYPRTELFATDEATLREIITGVLALAGRRKLKPFLRRDPYGRFYSCLVYLPRDRYTTSSRLAMQEVLLDELGGTGLEYSTRVGESALARVHFTVHTDPRSQVQPDLDRIQQRLNEAVRSWDDAMIDALRAEQRTRPHPDWPSAGSEAIHQLAQRWASGFPEAYKEDFPAEEGLRDLTRLRELSGHRDLDMYFYAPQGSTPDERRFKIFVRGGRISLSRVLPVLQAMGVEVVDERPYEVVFDGERYWICDFGLRVEKDLLVDDGTQPLDTLQERFEQTFRAAWLGDAEVDRFNALVLRAGLDWRQVVVLRAYAKYLRQVGTAYTQDYIENVVLDHREVALALVRLFEARFDPALSTAERAEQQERLQEEIGALLDEVSGLDTDRILRSYLNLVTATLRTNYFVSDEDGQRSYLALKLEPTAIAGLPEPRPRYEIFVYSPRTEGVHLRFGSVARGGLRWSDRRQDFRTEVLGLVKAQAVKNAVIVPLGAKGGFVVKRPPAATGDAAADREAQQAEGIACYRMFISGMLDLTDNLVDGRIAPPRGVVRHDGDDHYLVVAADKGTASFSDIANEVAGSYGFWLGDAFASGGSVGYDHKEMGITARGAWESVKRHFRELGVDTQREEFTVVGIGDMGGDVFGNGMLSSEHLKLVAAFNHMHVFIDPDPDPAASFAERQRLFATPRSTWDDYDRSAISQGGGVWSRSLKSIPLNPQIRTALGIDESVERLSPPELIREILHAPVDLLWNGGIGTYVKASTETHAEVGDKANDSVRVDGEQLRAKVVGEGGNLGLTELGRIEFARTGGKVNSDALDNSAGVDCSDHEVNIKIALDRLVSAGKLTRQQRNELLGDMTEEVAELVLADNRSQNRLLGVARSHAPEMLSVHARQITALERTGSLDRELEALPSQEEVQGRERAGDGLTSPELATLMAHVKLSLKEEVLSSDLPDEEAFTRRLPEYFPEPLRSQYADAIDAHPLRRQIITTLLVNEMVDNAGISYAFRLSEEISATATDAVRAFAAVTGIYDLHEVWREIDGLTGSVPSSVTDHLVLESRRLLDRASRWMLSNRPQPLAINAEINRFQSVVRELTGSVRSLLSGQALEAAEEKIRAWVEQGVPEQLAERVAVLVDSFALLDITEVAELAERDAGVSPERSPAESAELYYALWEHLDAERMLQAVNQLERGNRWHALARLALRDDFYATLRDIAVDVLRTSEPGQSAADKIARWESANSFRLQRARSVLTQIMGSGRLDLATLSVAARELRGMVR
ncbi:NAD-glutamate dehydrogenase [Salinifilum ghardaiensis]